jgi:hypothetical protein
MKTACMMAMIAMAAGNPMATRAEETKRSITVYLVDRRTDSIWPVAMAERYSSRIFATAGVQVEWRSGRPAETLSPTGMTFVVELVDRTPEAFHRSAMAYALPYEGVHIVVFFDRVEAMDKQFPGCVLGHVFVHEITHLLEGVSRHSETGVMKPSYTLADVKRMRSVPLQFAKEDLILIELGVERRDRMQRGAPVEAVADEELR